MKTAKRNDLIVQTSSAGKAIELQPGSPNRRLSLPASEPESRAGDPEDQVFDIEIIQGHVNFPEKQAFVAP